MAATMTFARSLTRTSLCWNKGRRIHNIIPSPCYIRQTRIPVETPALSRAYASKSFPSHTVITMPALSPTMQSGNIGTWQKKVGDTLAPGDVLVEIETDKAQMDFEFQEEGILAKILKESGEKDVAIGSPIAVMVEESENVSAFDSFTVDDAGGDKSAPKSPPEQEASESSEAPSSSTGTAPSTPETPSSPPSQESESSGERLETSLERQPKVSPSVKRLALEKGVPLSQVKGTGSGGRITKEDIETFKPATMDEPGSSASPLAVSTYEDTPASSMRKTIASRLTLSMNQNPHYYVTSKVSVTKLLKLRQALNSSSEGTYKLSVNDFMVKALATACRKVPEANSSWREEGKQTVIRQHNTVDVSVAVATPIGLMTPIVKSANTLGLSSISSQIKELGKRARDGKLKPEEYQGGTVTISNMGMNGAVDHFTAVINPPQAMILAVGTTKRVAVPVENEEGITEVAWDDQIILTGSFDHKVVDGAVGGELMKALKKVIENPLEMIL